LGWAIAIVDGEVWMAVHAVKPDLVFDCCYSKLFLAQDFPVELMLDSFDVCTLLLFVLSGG
jgi:hypothetical protein